ncbi:hypothetical protein, partial [Mycoplasma nasistruthionis]
TDAETKQESKNKTELESAKSALDQAIAKAQNDKTEKDVEVARNELKAVIAKKEEKLALYVDADDSKYTQKAIKDILETAFSNASTVAQTDTSTADELNQEKHKLENAILTADTSKNELRDLYNQTKSSLLDRFKKMFEYQSYQGINTTLFDKYNDAAVKFYNSGEKLTKENLQTIKDEITQALQAAEASKENANKLSTSVKGIRLINYNEINETRSNNNPDYTIDGNADLSIPFYADNDGRAAVKRNGELLFHFSKPTKIKSIRVHQYREVKIKMIFNHYSS